MYVLRWVIGFAVAAQGLYVIYWLLSSWAYLTDQAIIVPEMSPMRFLPGALLKTATGVAMLLRSRFAIWLSGAWLVAFVAMAATGPTLNGQFWAGVAELIGVVLFLVLLRSRQLLR